MLSARARKRHPPLILLLPSSLKCTLRGARLKSWPAAEALKELRCCRLERRFSQEERKSEAISEVDVRFMLWWWSSAASNKELWSCLR